MINGKSALAIIPARGGSKGLPRKNILPLGGKPMIAWTIEAAKKSKYIDRVIVSTDDKEIADISNANGAEVPFFRPPELATDEANSNEVILHAIQSIEEKYDFILLLQPTSPLRTHIEIDSAFDFLENHKAKTLVSVSASNHPPEWSIRLKNDLTFPDEFIVLSKNKRRQEYETSYEINGLIYISQVNQYLKYESFFTKDTIAFKIPKLRSIDIDTEIDLTYAEFLISKGLA